MADQWDAAMTDPSSLVADPQDAFEVNGHRLAICTCADDAGEDCALDDE